MENSIVTVVIVILSIWAVIVTVVLVRILGHYNNLTKGITHQTLSEILDKLLEAKLYNQKQINLLAKEFSSLEKKELTHFQRLGIVRFNPFSDTGGTQSFTMSFLDGQNNGIIMTSLYARTGNRWYIKHIRNGSGVDVDLSKEEQNAIKNAKPISEA